MPVLNGLDQVYRHVKPQMEALDQVLAERRGADVDCVAEMLDYAGRYSGKRLRPALIFVIADICGQLNDDHVKLGAVVEMIHVATLVHDDVLDHATMRRKAASLNVRWSNKDAILLGDILFARAINLLVTIGDHRALEVLTRSVSTICEGEIHQNQLSGNPDVDEATYTQIIQRKTASLYAAGCELAAHLAGSDEKLVQAFSNFGMSLGTAFQLIDDCLDFSQDEKVVGKSLGTDVLNGKMTLPLIHLLNSLEPKQRAEVEEIIRGNTRGVDGVQKIRSLLEEQGSDHDHLVKSFGKITIHHTQLGSSKLRWEKTSSCLFNLKLIELP